MTDLQIMLVTVASVWAAVNTVIAGYNAVNGTRDRILTGHTDEGIPMSLEHRELALRNDWLPMKSGIALISLLFFLFLVFLPDLAQLNRGIGLLCYLASVVPFFGFMTFSVLGFSDYKAMRRTLDAIRKEQKGQ